MTVCATVLVSSVMVALACGFLVLVTSCRAAGSWCYSKTGQASAGDGFRDYGEKYTTGAPQFANSDCAWLPRVCVHSTIHRTLCRQATASRWC